MSLKHILEAGKSPLQGSLMELIVSLVKSNKSEVDQALAVSVIGLAVYYIEYPY